MAFQTKYYKVVLKAVVSKTPAAKLTEVQALQKKIMTSVELVQKNKLSFVETEQRLWGPTDSVHTDLKDLFDILIRGTSRDGTQVHKRSPQRPVVAKRKTPLFLFLDWLEEAANPKKKKLDDILARTVKLQVAHDYLCNMNMASEAMSAEQADAEMKHMLGTTLPNFVSEYCGFLV